MITPEKLSAEFLSVVGHLDSRVDLDKNIHPNDQEYKALLSIMASKFAYENEQFISTMVTNHWGVSSSYLYINPLFYFIFEKHFNMHALWLFADGTFGAIQLLER